MSWVRAVAVLVILAGFVGYGYYGAIMAAQKLYERGVLKEPPVPMIDARAIAMQVAQYTAIAIILLIIIVAKKSTRLLGVVKVEDLRKHLLLVGHTGSGKTNAAKQAIALALRKGVKVVIIDWKALPLRKPLSPQLSPAAGGLLVRLGGPREESTSASSRELLSSGR